MATLSEKEWRSAAEEIRGANGSWTWTMSNGVEASRFLTPSPEPSTSDLVAAPLELLGDPRDVLVDRVAGAPPVRGHLGYRETVSRHALQHMRPRARRPRAQASVLASAFAAPATGTLPRAYLAMNSSVCSRASSSGRWLCGDFIR